ncbi:MAG: DinB family protein [Phycisphaerae bacterium]|nr:DinB family protein [Gemmatimonadaceae bacterium]
MNRIVAEFREAQQRVDVLATTIASDRWSLRRDPNSWSVGECIAHLNLTAHAYVPLLTAAWEAHPPAQPAPRHYRRDFMGWMLGYAAGPLPHIGGFRMGRVKTVASFVPTGDATRDKTVAEFRTTQDAQIQLTTLAEGRPLESIRIVSPFDSRVTYNAYACLVLLPRHQRRHLWQAEQVWR